jgi:hypothetical protein
LSKLEVNEKIINADIRSETKRSQQMSMTLVKRRENESEGLPKK